MKTITTKKHRIKHLLVIGLMLISNCLIQVNALAQKSEESPSNAPYFVVVSQKPGVDQLPLKSTRADVNITGVIADVTITQAYQNEGQNALEAIYVFPASSNAAIYAMEMQIGERTIVAKINEKGKARQKYEAAKAEGKRASLLEQHRPNVFQMNVANILPGDLIKVSLKYTEMIVPEEGTYQFVYPTVVGPRYVEKASASSQFASTPYVKGSAPLYQFDIKVNLSTGVPIQDLVSPSHQIKISHTQTDQAEIQLSENDNNRGNKDFVLNYQLSGNKVESGLMLYEHADENFFLLMVQPPKRIVKEDIPPREYVFIVDVSGSMRGFPLDVSKKLLRNLVVNLRPIDRFNVLVFAGTSGWLSNESLPAIPENIQRATTFLDDRRGGGGTNLLSALKKAMSLPHCEEGLSRSFIVVTDGYISVEKEAFDLIKNQADEANLFAFGIGSSVNRHLIEGMAHVGMSEPLIVLNQEGANEAAEKFRQYINYPVLTDMRRFFKGFDAYDVEPFALPDLLAERPLIIHGKYKGEPKGLITVKGRSAGKRYKKVFDVSKVSPSANHAALRYLWARKRIQMIDDYSILRDGGESQQTVTQLGLKYNLMTAYTSFLAVEEKKVANGQPRSVKQPLPIPQNVPNTAVGFDMELDEGDVEFSYHKEIVVEGYLDITQEIQVISRVTDQLITKLNGFLNNHPVSLEAIVFEIDQRGSVKNVKIKATHLSKKLRDELKQLILNTNHLKNPSEGLLKITVLF